MSNREILFKAKREDNGEWIEGYLYKKMESVFIIGVNSGNSDWDSVSGYCYTNDESLDVWPACKVIPETVCQYTGLKDKNEKKIWEGDKLGDKGAYVIWDKRLCCWAFAFPNSEDTTPLFFDNNFKDMPYKVIGSIHDEEKK